MHWGPMGPYAGKTWSHLPYPLIPWGGPSIPASLPSPPAGPGLLYPLLHNHGFHLSGIPQKGPRRGRQPLCPAWGGGWFWLTLAALWDLTPRQRPVVPVFIQQTFNPFPEPGGVQGANSKSRTVCFSLLELRGAGLGHLGAGSVGSRPGWSVGLGEEVSHSITGPGLEGRGFVLEPGLGTSSGLSDSRWGWSS